MMAGEPSDSMNRVIFDIKEPKELSPTFSVFFCRNVFKLVLSSQMMISKSIRVLRAAQTELFGPVSQRCLQTSSQMTAF